MSPNLTNPAGYVAGVALIEKASGAKATVYTKPGMDTPVLCHLMVQVTIRSFSCDFRKQDFAPQPRPKC